MSRSDYEDTRGWGVTPKANQAGFSPPNHNDGASPASGTTTSLLSAVQTHWIELCAYFASVQCADSVQERADIASRLPSVKYHLDCILEALLLECKSMMSEGGGGGSGACNDYGGVSNPRVATRLFSGAGECVPDSTAAAAPVRSLCAGVALPPCYFFLFGEEACEEEVEGGAAACDVCSPLDPDSPSPAPLQTSSSPLDAAEAERTSGGPSIGPTFLLLLCQYMKHNEPAGTRQVILRFLTRLLDEADLPPRLHTSGHGGYGESPQSLLELHPISSFVPLLDMIRKVGATLDLSQRKRSAIAAARTVSGGVTIPASSQPGSAGRGSRGGREAAATAVSSTASVSVAQGYSDDAERTEFVLFLCALAERTERVPRLANFFVVEEAVCEAGEGKEGNEPSSSVAPASALAGGVRERFVLLDVLLPYLTHDGSAPGWQHRRDTCRFALSAVLSLAKCPDAWVQDIVARETGITDRTLTGARVTMLTLCKVPDNDDSAAQMLYMVDVLRFWSALSLCAPVVARALKLEEMVEQDFVRATVLPLFRASDTHTYAAACVVMSSLLAELPREAPLVSTALVKGLLGTAVSPVNGRVLTEKRDYYREAAAAARGRAGMGERGVASSLAMTATAPVSFATYYLLPRLSVRPTLSEEDLVSVSLGFALTEWTATEATLTLLRALLTTNPYHFMRYALLLDMHDFPRVDVAAAPAPRSHPGSHEETPRTRRLRLRTAASAPVIDVSDCFPTCLRTSSDMVCGVSAKELAEGVLNHLLVIEGNTPFSALSSRLGGVNTFCSGVPLKSQQDADQEHGDDADAGSADKNWHPSNRWFHRDVHAAPCVEALCHLVSCALRLPYRVNVLLTSVLSSLCVLPDMRVLYTLMDPEYGRLGHSLRKVRALVENELDDDAKVAFATAAAAAAVAEDARVDGGNSELAVTPARAPSSAGAVTPSTLARRSSSSSAGRDGDDGEDDDDLYSATNLAKSLFGAFTSGWDAVSWTMGGWESVASRLSNLRQSIARTHTRIYLYEMFLQHFDVLSGGTSAWRVPESLSEETYKAILQNRQFLEACVSLEYLRIELDAAVGYVSLSHNLLTLSPGLAASTTAAT